MDLVFKCKILQDFDADTFLVGLIEPLAEFLGDSLRCPFQSETAAPQYYPENIGIFNNHFIDLLVKWVDRDSQENKSLRCVSMHFVH